MSRKTEGFEQLYSEIGVQPHSVTWNLLTIGLRILSSFSFFIYHFLKKKNENKKTPYLKNQKDMSGHIWRAELQLCVYPENTPP